MRLPHRLQGQKVKSQGGAGAYCGGHLDAQLVSTVGLLNLCIDGKLLIETDSSFQISLRLHLIYFSYKIFSLRLKTTKLSLESCRPAINFSSDCYSDLLHVLINLTHKYELTSDCLLVTLT